MQLDFTSSQIASILNVSTEHQHHFSKIIIDSRRVTNAEETLFIAFKGLQNNGHDYIESLYNLGVRGFIVDPNFDKSAYPEASFFVTKNPVQSLQKIAHVHRKKFNIPIIGITGSYGKTIVKEWLYELLTKDEVICRSPKSYNSKIGLPLSLLELNESHTLGIFEMGISRSGEMEKLVDIAEPDLGILTNIGTAHLENFDDKIDLIHEKLALLESSKKVVYPADIDYTHSNSITFGTGGDVEWTRDHNCLKFTYADLSFDIGLFDGAIPENVACCVAVLLKLGKKPENFAGKFTDLSGLALRLEKIKGKQNNTIFLDAYNNDLIGLHAVLQHMGSEQSKTNILVLSDLENGSKEDYEQAATIINQFDIDLLIGVGIDIKTISQFLKASIDFQHVRDIDAFDFSSISDTTIILKGSRKFHFERIIPGLEYKRHEAAIYIDIQNLRKNLHDIQLRIQPQTKLMVMLKAEAYGTGIQDIAQFYVSQNVNYFGVAYAQEGISLRNAQIELPIMIMNVSPNDFDIIIDEKLEPTINSYEALDSFIKRCLYRGVTNYPIHLNLETGMHRLGMEEDDIIKSIDLIEAQPEVFLKSVYSHLACADQPDNAYNEKQFEIFERWVLQIKKHYSNEFDTHILNSSGIYHFPEHQYSMVRVGIGLYGLSRRMNESVLSFAGRISKIKKLQKGDSVGYNQSYIAPECVTIATIPIGYADGLPRALGNSNWSFRDEKHQYPIIGDVCMDMCMIDISSNPNLQVGDEVFLFRNNKEIVELSKILHTIPYEVITHFSDRIRRVLVE